MCPCCNFQDNKCALGTLFPTAAGLKEGVWHPQLGRSWRGLEWPLSFIQRHLSIPKPPSCQAEHFVCGLQAKCSVVNEKVVLKLVVPEEGSVCEKEGSQVQRSLLSSVQAGQGQGEMLWCIITPRSQWVHMVCAFLDCTDHKIPGVYGPSLFWEMPHSTVLP